MGSGASTTTWKLPARDGAAAVGMKSKPDGAMVRKSSAAHSERRGAAADQTGSALSRADGRSLSPGSSVAGGSGARSSAPPSILMRRDLGTASGVPLAVEQWSAELVPPYAGPPHTTLVAARLHCPLGRGSGRFKHGRPTAVLSGEEIFPCFDRGLFYRIVAVDRQEWRLYNDTVAYDMRAVYVFAPHSNVVPLGRTTTEKRADGKIVARATVHPGETVSFVTGSWLSFDSEVEVQPVSPAWIKETMDATEPFLESDMENLCALLKTKGRKPYNVVGKTMSLEGNWRSARFEGVSDEDLVQWCAKSQTPFVDVNFPPISWTTIGVRESDSRGWCGWARPSTVLPYPAATEVRLFCCSAVTPMNISESDLGDDWLISAIAVLAEAGGAVQNMFSHPGDDAQLAAKEHVVGAYRATLNVDGWWRSVIVDDYLPYIGSRPKFGKSLNDPSELWVSILEKAYAKLHGSYASITAGDPLQALQDMTGYPTTRYDTVMAEACRAVGAKVGFFTTIQRFISLGFIVVVDKANTLIPREEFQHLGLRASCAYRVVGYCEITPTSGLVRIRNTWGRGGDWRGDWGKMSTKWAQFPDVAIACHYTGEEDGTFWMSWDDLLEGFTGCGVCFAHTNFHEYRLRCGFDGAFADTAVKLKVSRHSYLVAMLTQRVAPRTSVASDHKGRPSKSRTLTDWASARSGASLSTRCETSNWLPIGLSLTAQTEVHEERRHRGTPRAPGAQRGATAPSLSPSAKDPKVRGLAKKGKVTVNQVAWIHASADTDRPREELVYISQEAVSLLCELQPSDSPYYVVPRITSPCTGRSLPPRTECVLTLFTSVPLGREKSRKRASRRTRGRHASEQQLTQARVSSIERPGSVASDSTGSRTCSVYDDGDQESAAGQATATFVHLPANCALFTGNGTIFSTSRETKAKREYQYRAPGGSRHPVQGMGTHFHTY